jgi:hypothetical protein
MPPAPNMIQILDLRSTYLFVNVSASPQLQQLNALGNYADRWELDNILEVPLITHFDLGCSHMTSSRATLTPSGETLNGGMSTHWILSHLNSTNPLLRYLDIGGSKIVFGEPDPVSNSNFPLINAPLLTYLGISQLPTLITSNSGPDSRWLAGMPQLKTLSAGSLPFATIRLDAFALASRQLSEIELSSTPVTGHLDSPAFIGLNALSTLTMDDSGVVSRLPQNVSAVWPALTILSLQRCNVHGPLPDFANLSQLLAIRLGNNEIR